MRKVVSGWVSRSSDLEPMLIEMCGRIGAVIQGKKRKDSCRVSVRLIVEGEHHQAEKPKTKPCPKLEQALNHLLDDDAATCE